MSASANESPNKSTENQIADTSNEGDETLPPNNQDDYFTSDDVCLSTQFFTQDSQEELMRYDERNLNFEETAENENLEESDDILPPGCLPEDLLPPMPLVPHHLRNKSPEHNEEKQTRNINSFSPGVNEKSAFDNAEMTIPLHDAKIIPTELLHETNDSLLSLSVDNANQRRKKKKKKAGFIPPLFHDNTNLVPSVPADKMTNYVAQYPTVNYAAQYPPNKYYAGNTYYPYMSSGGQDIPFPFANTIPPPPPPDDNSEDLAQAVPPLMVGCSGRAMPQNAVLNPESGMEKNETSNVDQFQSRNNQMVNANLVNEPQAVLFPRNAMTAEEEEGKYEFIDNTRYSPTRTESDDEVQDSNTKTKVLGKEQAKRRLMAFSSFKQTSSPVKKPNIPAKTGKYKPPNPNKGAGVQEQFRATVSAIEEEKRKMLQAMPNYAFAERRDLLRAGALPSSFQNSEKKDGQEKEDEKSRRHPSADGKRRRSGSRNRKRSRSRRRSRSRSKNRSSSQSRNRRRSRDRNRRDDYNRNKNSDDKNDKSKEKVGEKKETDSNSRTKELPKDWERFIASGLELGSDELQELKSRFERGKKNDNRKNSNDKPEFKPVFHYLKETRRMNWLQAKPAAEGKSFEYSEKTLKFTLTKPMIHWTENKDHATDFLMPRKMLLENCDQDILPILTAITDSKTQTYPDLEPLTEQPWYPRRDYLRSSQKWESFAKIEPEEKLDNGESESKKISVKVNELDETEEKSDKKDRRKVENPKDKKAQNLKKEEGNRHYEEKPKRNKETKNRERKISLVDDNYSSASDNDRSPIRDLFVGDVKVKVDLDSNKVKVLSRWDSDYEDGDAKADDKPVEDMEIATPEDQSDNFILVDEAPLSDNDNFVFQTGGNSPVRKTEQLQEQIPGKLVSEYEEFIKMVSSETKIADDAEKGGNFPSGEIEDSRLGLIDWDRLSYRSEKSSAKIEFLPEIPFRRPEEDLDSSVKSGVKNGKRKKNSVKKKKLDKKKRKLKETKKAKKKKQKSSSDSSSESSESESSEDEDSRKKKKKKKTSKEKKTNSSSSSESSDSEENDVRRKKSKAKKKKAKTKKIKRANSVESDGEVQNEMLKELGIKKQQIMKKIEEIDSISERSKKKGKENSSKKEEDPKGGKKRKIEGKTKDEKPPKKKPKTTERKKKSPIKESKKSADSDEEEEIKKKKKKKTAKKKKETSESSSSSSEEELNDAVVKKSSSKSSKKTEKKSKTKKLKEVKKKKKKRKSSESETESEVESRKKKMKKKKHLEESKSEAIKPRPEPEAIRKQAINDDWEKPSSSDEKPEEPDSRTDSSWDEKSPKKSEISVQKLDVEIGKTESLGNTSITSNSQAVPGFLPPPIVSESSYHSFGQDLSADFFSAGRQFESVNSESNKPPASELYSPGHSDSEASEENVKTEVYDPLNAESEGSLENKEVDTGLIPAKVAAEIAPSAEIRAFSEVTAESIQTPPISNPILPDAVVAPAKISVFSVKTQQRGLAKAAAVFQDESDEEPVKEDIRRKAVSDETNKRDDGRKRSRSRDRERKRRRSRSRERDNRKRSVSPEKSGKGTEIRSEQNSSKYEPSEVKTQPIPVLTGLETSSVGDAVWERNDFDYSESDYRYQEFPTENFERHYEVKRSPERRRSPRRSISPRKRNRSPTPKRNRSPTPKRNRSPTPKRNRSPTPKRNRSLTPKRNRSPSPRRRSPRRRYRSSRSPERRRKSRSRSPRKKRRSPRRSRSASPRKRRSSPKRKDSPKSDNYYREVQNRIPVIETRSDGIDMDLSPSAAQSPRFESPMGFSRSLADSTISDSELSSTFYNREYPGEFPAAVGYPEEISGNNLITVKNHDIGKDTDSPKRLSLDQRIELELGVRLSKAAEDHAEQYSAPQSYQHFPETQFSSSYCDNTAGDNAAGSGQNFYQNPSNPEYDGQFYNGSQVAYGQYPQYPVPHHQQSSVLQVGNIMEVVPTLQAPPPPPPPPVKNQQIMQVGNVLQVVPSAKPIHASVPPPLPPAAPHYSAPPSQPTPAVQKATAVVAPSSVVVPPAPEAVVNPLIKAIQLEREKRKKEKEKRKAEREARRRARQLRREAKMMSVNEKLKKSVQDEGVMLGQELDDEEILDALEVPSPPIPVEIITVSNQGSLPPAGKGILITEGFRDKPASEKKEVRFADGICPGEGTSTSGGDEPSPPPKPKLPKEKRYKKKKTKLKKKVKVHIIRQVIQDEDDEEEEDDLSPPPPPPGDPPPVFFAKFPFGGQAQYPIYQSQTTTTTILTKVQYPAQPFQ